MMMMPTLPVSTARAITLCKTCAIVPL